MNRTHGFSSDFYMISPALAPQSSISPSSLRIHFSVSATCPRFCGVHAKFNALSSSLPKRDGFGMEKRRRFQKATGIRLQTHPCCESSLGNMTVWVSKIRDLIYRYILPSTMLPLYRSKALDPFLFQT